jgi:hypothetical protein
MQTITHVINTLAPVFLIIALGTVLCRSGFLPKELLRGMNRLAYWVGLPCLLFGKLAAAGPMDSAAAETLWVLLLGTAGLIVISLAAAFAGRLHAGRVGTFMQASFRGNLAYVGLPVVFYAFSSGADSGPGQRAETLALLAIGPVVVLYNAVAVIALLASQHKMKFAAIKHMAWQMITNPLLLACAAGVTWSQLQLPLPLPVGRTLDTLGVFALPLALLCVGGALATTSIRGHIGPALAASLIKVVIGPALGYAIARMLGAGQQAAFVAMILLACPTAVASYVLTEQLKGDTALAAGSIVLSTLLSAISLGVVIALM